MVDNDPFARIRVVLCETSHPGNIGAVARAMKTMGLSDLRLVSPGRFPDPEAVWRASRATDVLEHAQIHPSLDDALTGVAMSVAATARTREMAVPAVDAREAASRAVEIAQSQPVALVFGNEQSGLTTEQVNRCSIIASIPANPEYSSLNLGAAVQVLAYEIRMSALGEGTTAPGPLRTRATSDEVEGFYAHLESSMIESGFFDPDTDPKKLMPRVRRLFARAELEHDEVNILRGIVKALTGSKKR